MYTTNSANEYPRDYARRGRIGVSTPQANPTVEPEMALLLPSNINMLATRLTSKNEPRQRFIDYFEQLTTSLESFDTLKLDAYAFGCTASSYLIDEQTETDTVDALEQRFECKVVTAASAIQEALQFLGANKIALACPYPQWLLDDAYRYWASKGYDIALGTSVQPDTVDTRSIYELRGGDAAAKIGPLFEQVEADVYVITGTGMPGLQAIIDLQQALGKPVITSNLCTAWACLRRTGIDFNDRAPDARFPLLSGWQSGLSRL